VRSQENFANSIVINVNKSSYIPPTEANCHTTDKRGRTYLHIAVEKNGLRVAKYLTGLRANVNLADRKG
jgi:hypothetical protein